MAQLEKLVGSEGTGGHLGDNHANLKVDEKIYLKEDEDRTSNEGDIVYTLILKINGNRVAFLDKARRFQ